MADLVSQANRLNDVEINNNAPVSSQTFRRVGSDINYLLDYLGVPNGATIGGPTTGLNVFSPAQTISYSKTFTNSDNNVSVSLFSFQGAGDRPLYFFNKSNNFSAVSISIDQTSVPGTSTVNPGPQIVPTGLSRHLVDHSRYPIFYLLYQLALTNIGTGVSGPITPPLYSVYLNGILAGTLHVQDGGSPTDRVVLTQNMEITHAPVGTNTVSVIRDPRNVVNSTVSYSTLYVAL